MRKQFYLSIVLLFAFISIYANNLRVTGGQQVSENEVSFNISWENSWNVQGKPGNHDAVWIFIKYRECGGTGPWLHALLSTNMADHTMSSTITPATPVSLNDRFGNLPAGATETNGLGNNTGIMIKRSDIGKGNITNATCTLKVVQAVGVPFPTGLDFEIKVIGIEMVWVNTGQFIVGDNGATPNSYAEKIVANEDAVAAGFYGVQQDALPAEFPKGYQGFYCMKYEITQGQYYELITTGANMTRSPADYSGEYRNTLSLTGVTAPDRAQNFMSWRFLSAYLDWACLRPITEMEYEKACRGTADMFNLYSFAWGTNSFTRILYVSGTEDGTEKCATTGANCHCYYPMLTAFSTNPGCPPPGGIQNGSTGAVWSDAAKFSAISSPECEAKIPSYLPLVASAGWNYNYFTPIYMCGSDQSQGWGPVGAGIFARNGTETRESSGASYYGIMEMSGNLWEQCMSTKHNENFTGVWGNGYLNVGKADVPNWPTYETYITLRGGGYGATYDFMRVCNRTYYQWYTYENCSDATGPNNVNGRRGDMGGRGAR